MSGEKMGTQCRYHVPKREMTDRRPYHSPMCLISLTNDSREENMTSVVRERISGLSPTHSCRVRARNKSFYFLLLAYQVPAWEANHVRLSKMLSSIRNCAGNLSRIRAAYNR